MLKLKIIMAVLMAIAPSAAYGYTSNTQSAMTQLAQTTSPSDQNPITTSDRLFMIQAAQGGLAEVQLGQLASQKASNPEVRQYGQRMVKDHTQANDELKQLAAQKGVELPQTLSQKDMAVKQQLSKLSGPAFDREYMNQMVQDHKQQVSLFQRQTRQGQDPELKAWATETLPTLQEHLQLADNISNQIGS